MLPAGKIVRLKQKLADVTGAVGKLFGRKQEKDPAVAKLDAVKVSHTAAVALRIQGGKPDVPLCGASAAMSDTPGGHLGQ